MKTILLAQTALLMMAPASALSRETARQPREEHDKQIKLAQTVGLETKTGNS